MNKNKLNINVITPFPKMFDIMTNESIMLKASEKGLVNFNICNLFDYLKTAKDRIDDYPFGGGEGMIMKAEPIANALEKIKKNNHVTSRIVFPTPDGKLFNQEIAYNLANEKSLIFISGHYKGIDQRIRDEFVTDEYSIGDYVLTNGELPTMLMLDSIVRLKEGVLNNYKSATKDSFSEELLDGPHYTRPRIFNNAAVPDVLLSGNHKEIEKWFLKERDKKTKKRRKDLWDKYTMRNRNGDKNG